MNSLYISKDFQKKIVKFALQKALEGDILTIRKLIEKKRLHVEAQDENGATLLSIAVWSAKYDCARTLIDSLKADVNTQDFNGWTPLIIASYENNLKMAKLLWESGADASARNLEGISAIDFAKTDEMKAYLEK